MDRESVERLRFDRRLQRRRDWVDPKDYDAYIESLPDTSEKMTRGLDEESDAATPPAAAAGFAPPTSTGEVPAAGSFPDGSSNPS